MEIKNVNPTWLTKQHKAEIRKVFEPRYKRKLTNLEVIQIAENLTSVIEEICKYRWRQKYG